MSVLDILLQQVINGLALGMMYALLALGFTMVYGIIELINFAHFNVFMSGHLRGPTGAERSWASPAVCQSLTGLALVGMLLVALPRHHADHGRARACSIERRLPAPAAQRLRAPRR